MPNEAAASLPAEADPIDERIEEVLAMHGGDPRSAIGALLVEADALKASISFGYVRGRIPIIGKVTG